jgi:hypothetical protein
MSSRSDVLNIMTNGDGTNGSSGMMRTQQEKGPIARVLKLEFRIDEGSITLAILH